MSGPAIRPKVQFDRCGQTRKAMETQSHRDNCHLTVSLPRSAVAWLKSFPNTPALPASWVECNGLPLNVNGRTVAAGADVTIFPPANYNSDPASSLPPYYEVVRVMRIK
jgi:hypothetical protein